MRWMCNALDVAVGRGQPGHVVANNRIGLAHIETVAGRGADRVGQVLTIEPPELVEGQLIKREDSLPVTSSSSSQARGFVGAGGIEVSGGHIAQE